MNEPLSKLIEHSRSLPRAAKPRGESVFLVTLHPSYLAKSYYPEKLLYATGLRDLGSKERVITPRKAIGKGKQDKPLATSCLYVAGTEASIAAFQSTLFDDGIPKYLKDDFIKIEEISELSTEDKIKGEILDEAKVQKYEVVLHAGQDEDDIVVAFANYAKTFGGEADLARSIQIGGLTFLPLSASHSSLRNISNFSFLRVARPMPKIRLTPPAIMRQISQMKGPQLPEHGPLDTAVKVAVFDGGLGIKDLSSWSHEHVLPGHESTEADFLRHGNEVTSTILFGRITPSQLHLPRPYAHVDHFRVISSNSKNDCDLFDVLKDISGVLDSGIYKYVNLSLGPRLPIDDDQIHPWTATLDHLCAKHSIFLTVAVGNDGELEGANRIQPPGDMVNALAVGAADRSGETWKRAAYSCIGPGRSPGLVKPDGVAFGGSEHEPFLALNPLMGGVSEVCGTSFSSPLVLRTAIGLGVTTDFPLTSIAIKSLLVHHADSGIEAREHIGWGRFTESVDKILECAPDSVTIIYQGFLAKGEYLRAPIPFPGIVLPSEAHLKATLCLMTKTDPEHSINYTRSGMTVVFRPRFGANENDSTTFFAKSTQYVSERECRDDGHKWETCLKHTQKFKATDLFDPVFDIEYNVREMSHGISVGSAPDMQYAMAVTLSVKGMPELYNLVRQRYTILQPIQIKQHITVSA